MLAESNDNLLEMPGPGGAIWHKDEIMTQNELDSGEARHISGKVDSCAASDRSDPQIILGGSDRHRR